MIERRVSFHNMPHSEALEGHANSKIDKLKKLLEGTGLPQEIEVHIKYNPHRAHHEVEVNLISKQIRTEAHSVNSEIYLAVDEAMDKIIEAVRRSKDRSTTQAHRKETEKKAFYDQELEFEDDKEFSFNDDDDDLEDKF